LLVAEINSATAAASAALASRASTVPRYWPRFLMIETPDCVPAAPVSVMAQFHPDNFCDPASGKYRDKYAEIARQRTHAELNSSWRRACELGLQFETTTFERRIAFGMPATWKADRASPVGSKVAFY
jgi:hypothetical protein